MVVVSGIGVVVVVVEVVVVVAAVVVVVVVGVEVVRDDAVIVSRGGYKYVWLLALILMPYEPMSRSVGIVAAPAVGHHFLLL